ncbi:MAG TPA: sugar-binding protein, partial [Verrucomicrobiota bacterium]|nr:sugar-binding protein [Verrucomicrobiota bacterium]
HGTTYDSFDRQFIKGHADSTLFEKNGNLAGVLHATAAIPGGFAVELAIPWASFGVTPAAGLVIGFDVGNNDDDDGAGREHQTTWRGTSGNWNNTSAFGDLRLSAETVGAVNTPPTISDIPDQVLPPGGAVSGLAFTVGDAETPAGSLALTASSSNPALLPNASLVLGGSGAGRTLSFVPVPGVLGSSVVTVTVSDGQATATEAFTVTVTRGEVLFVVENPAALNAADAGVRNRLVAGGFSVQLQDDDTTASGQAAGKALIVISSTVVSGAVNTKFRDAAVPVLNWEPALQDDFAFTGTSFGTDMDTLAGQTQLNIINPAHPLAAGLAAGLQTVTLSGQTFTWGAPAASAHVVATLA